MSFPVFKDLDRSVGDLFNDDFDLKYSFKIKSAGPENTTITTTTSYDTKESKITPKFSVKYPHSTGFTLEKLEVSPDLKYSIETSLIGVTPGLKLEFKANDADKSDLSLTYTLPKATVTADFDIHNFSSAKSSVLTGHGPFSGGASLDVAFAKTSVQSVTFGLGLGYSISNFFATVRATNNFAKFGSLLSYKIDSASTIGGKVDYTKKDGPTAAILALYKCTPAVTVKAKATSTGVFSGSVKQSFEKKFAVVGSIEIPKDFNTIKFGVNATLG
jgi:hypothetical protein